MSVTTYKNGIPLVSIPVSIGTTPANGASLPWPNSSGSSKPYLWTTTLTVTTQANSGSQPQPLPLQKFTYTGQNINVGMWIANLSTGLVWQIVSISAKTAGSVSCTLQDISRYNTYRDPAKTGNGKPPTGAYVAFNLGETGIPMIDPVPTGAGANFPIVVNARFQYINKQFDIALNQPGFAGVSFQFGDVLAIDEPTQTYVLADTAHASTVVGTVTSVDDTTTIFTVNPVRKVVDDLNSLPGNVGDIAYVDNSNPGQLTSTSGGAAVYLTLRANTLSTTVSNVFVDTVTPVTTPGFTFYVNNVSATIGGSGIPLDVVNAINSTSTTSGVSATLQTVPNVQIIITAVDARAINFTDITGSVTTDAGLVSAENGIKAIGLIIEGGVTNSTPAGLMNSYGYVFVKAVAATTWNITHNAGTTNVSAQIFDNTTGTAASGSVILPDQITIVDINNITVTFQAVQAGTALLTIFK